MSSALTVRLATARPVVTCLHIEFESLNHSTRRTKPFSCKCNVACRGHPEFVHVDVYTHTRNHEQKLKLKVFSSEVHVCDKKNLWDVLKRKILHACPSVSHCWPSLQQRGESGSVSLYLIFVPLFDLSLCLQRSIDSRCTAVVGAEDCSCTHLSL